MRDEQYNRAYELLLKAKAIDPKDPAVIHLDGELAKRMGTGEEDDIIDG
jgi:hypothetical protein